ncbi:hypothetical protein K3N28_17515 [Glycomyces sp. TRM65418]|uniref:hypothetical protein n=1 Tax=Glycomyces sp. TRM65418 TaxID=2867006 RepID=UPI001CE6B337|nr:hypothetical protein [Glycomyces sp. TRM65418]MCC3764859.1 hypothetical protein [Glycomyces sp. TRM65418]QZD54506.1 hypothetical protein K3N28_17430 [Glycomyces sp. TRM65418]
MTGDAGPAAGYGLLLIAQVGFVVFVVLAFAYAVLVVMAALGLTSFTAFERFRRRGGEDPGEGGIDDLF